MLKIKWLGQSGYILSNDTASICIDPYLSDSVNRIENRPRLREVPINPKDLDVDAIICTHDHLDHLDIDAIPLMDKENMTFLAPSACQSSLSQLGVKNYLQFDEGIVTKIGDFEIESVFADHTVPAVGVIVRCGGITLYFSGDTYYNKRLEAIRCDFMFICINGRMGNMNADEAVELANIIKPALAVPNHYDMFKSNSENPEKFTSRVKNSFIMEFNKDYEVADKCLI